jgi:hypothetical protein
MTLLEAKRAFPKAIFSRGSDGEGVALVNVSTKESQVMVLYAGEEDKDKPINWSRKILSIETFSPNCSTGLGVRPGGLVAEAEQQYGKVLKIIMSEIEARQFVEFKINLGAWFFELTTRVFSLKGKVKPSDIVLMQKSIR